jgi:hypothetical protein
MDPAKAERSAASGSGTSASVWTKQSRVAKPGSIIPAPLACAEMVTPPARTAHRFGLLSVVMIACAKSSPPSADRPSTASNTPAVTASMSSGTPIVPVSATTTVRGSTSSASAAASRIARASLYPCSPVAALALPELTATARIACASQSSRQTRTGAAAAALRVSARADRTPGSSQASTPTSVAPSSFSPHATPVARKPAASWAGSSSSTPSGGVTQREAKKVLVAGLTRSPPPPAGRASG